MVFGRLREEIKKKFGKLGTFADAMGLNHATFSRKINGKADFTRSEIVLIIELLGLDYSSIQPLFFYD